MVMLATNCKTHHIYLKGIEVCKEEKEADEVINVDAAEMPAASLVLYSIVEAIQMQADLLQWLVAHSPDFTSDNLLAWHM